MVGYLTALGVIGPARHCRQGGTSGGDRRADWSAMFQFKAGQAVDKSIGSGWGRSGWGRGRRRRWTGPAKVVPDELLEGAGCMEEIIAKRIFVFVRENRGGR